MKVDGPFETINGLRGIAAVVVVTFHASSLFSPFDAENAYLAVDLFFVISGFVLGTAYDNKLISGLRPLRFMTLRFLRLYPLYAIALIPSVIAFLMGASPPGGEWTFPTFVASLALATFMLPSPILPGGYLYTFNGPAWSLMSELIINWVYAVFRRYLALMISLPIALVSIIVFTALYHKHIPDFGFNLKGTPAGLARVFYSFFMGLLIYRVFDEKKRRRSTIGPYLMLASVVVVLTMPMPEALMPYYGVVAIAVIMPLLVYCAAKFEPRNGMRIFHVLGLTSYAIYAIHWPLLLLCNQVAALIGVNLASYAPWSGVVFIVMVGFAALGLDVYYDAPVRKRLLTVYRDYART